MSLESHKLTAIHLATSSSTSTVTLTLASTTGATNRYIHGFRGASAGTAGTVTLAEGATNIWYMRFYTSSAGVCDFPAPIPTRASNAITVVVVGGASSTYAGIEYSVA